MSDTQHKHESLASAVEAAVALSKEAGTASIVLSRGSYYVEQVPGMIRTWEEVIGEYENGELLPDYRLDMSEAIESEAETALNKQHPELNP